MSSRRKKSVQLVNFSILTRVDSIHARSWLILEGVTAERDAFFLSWFVEMPALVELSG